MLQQLLIIVGVMLALMPMSVNALDYQPVSDCVIEGFNSDITLDAHSNLSIAESHGLIRCLKFKAETLSIGVWS